MLFCFYEYCKYILSYYSDLFNGKLKYAFAKECGEVEQPIKNFAQKFDENYFSEERTIIRKYRENAVKAKHLLTRHKYYQSILKQLIMRDMV